MLCCRELQEPKLAASLTCYFLSCLAVLVLSAENKTLYLSKSFFFFIPSSYECFVLLGTPVADYPIPCHTLIIRSPCLLFWQGQLSSVLAALWIHVRSFHVCIAGLDFFVCGWFFFIIYFLLLLLFFSRKTNSFKKKKKRFGERDELAFLKVRALRGHS